MAAAPLLLTFLSICYFVIFVKAAAPGISPPTKNDDNQLDLSGLPLTIQIPGGIEISQNNGQWTDSSGQIYKPVSKPFLAMESGQESPTISWEINWRRSNGSSDEDEGTVDQETLNSILEQNLELQQVEEESQGESQVDEEPQEEEPQEEEPQEEEESQGDSQEEPTTAEPSPPSGEPKIPETPSFPLPPTDIEAGLGNEPTDGQKATENEDPQGTKANEGRDDENSERTPNGDGGESSVDEFGADIVPEATPTTSVPDRTTSTTQIPWWLTSTSSTQRPTTTTIIPWWLTSTSSTQRPTTTTIIPWWVTSTTTPRSTKVTTTIPWWSRTSSKVTKAIIQITTRRPAIVTTHRAVIHPVTTIAPFTSRRPPPTRAPSVAINTPSRRVWPTTTPRMPIPIRPTRPSQSPQRVNTPSSNIRPNFGNNRQPKIRPSWNSIFRGPFSPRNPHKHIPIRIPNRNPGRTSSRHLSPIRPGHVTIHRPFHTPAVHRKPPTPKHTGRFPSRRHPQRKPARPTRLRPSFPARKTTPLPRVDSKHIDTPIKRYWVTVPRHKHRSRLANHRSTHRRRRPTIKRIPTVWKFPKTRPPFHRRLASGRSRVVRRKN